MPVYSNRYRLLIVLWRFPRFITVRLANILINFHFLIEPTELGRNLDKFLNYSLNDYAVNDSKFPPEIRSDIFSNAPIRFPKNMRKFISL